MKWKRSKENHKSIKQMPTLIDRKSPFWGRCDECGRKTVLILDGNRNELKLLCKECSQKVFYFVDIPAC